MTFWHILIAIGALVVLIDIIGCVVFKEIRHDFFCTSPGILLKSDPWYVIAFGVLFIILILPLLVLVYIFGICYRTFYAISHYSEDKENRIREHNREIIQSVKDKLESQLSERNYFEGILKAGKLRNILLPPDKYPDASYAEIILLDFTEESSLEALVEANRSDLEPVMKGWNENYSFTVISRKHPLVFSNEVSRYYAPSEKTGQELSLSCDNVLNFFGFNRADVGQGCIIHLKYMPHPLLRRPEEGRVNGVFLGSEAANYRKGDVLDYTMFPFDIEDKRYFILDFYSILKVLRPGHDVFFSVNVPEKDEDYADNTFSESDYIDNLAAEIKDRIEKLRQYGIGEAAILSLLATEPKLSGIRITKDYKIILPDYGGREINLPPLHKAIYLLFLKHPEGIRFKELSDYKAEIRELYLSVSGRVDMKKMESSIDSICDSTTNSINEKCSRIRAAFLSEFSERIADNYSICGKAKEKKHIPIASKAGMVTWE